MTGPLIIAGMVLFIFFAGWYAIWDWNRAEAKLIRRAEVEAWRRYRDEIYPPISLAAPYQDAITHTLTRENLVTANHLIARLEQARHPVVLEVVG